VESREDIEQEEDQRKGQVPSTVEGDTWESRENLKNAGDALKEFEEEYSRDNREVR